MSAENRRYGINKQQKMVAVCGFEGELTTLKSQMCVYSSMYLSVKFMIWCTHTLTETANFEIFQAHKSGIYDIRWLQYIVMCIYHIVHIAPHHPSVHFFPFYHSTATFIERYEKRDDCAHRAVFLWFDAAAAAAATGVAVRCLQLSYIYERVFYGQI